MDRYGQLVSAGDSYVRAIEAAQEDFRQNSAARGAVGQHVSSMEGQLKDIDGALKKVQSISMQVNILAINASIEAARAGVAGKGFAVVAQEVGNLAKNTGAAVEEISESLAKLKKMLENTVLNMENAKAVGKTFDGALAGCVEQARALNALIAQQAQGGPDAAAY